VNSTGGAALAATNVNNGSLTQSTLTSTNSATNGLSFSGVSGIFDVNNSTLQLPNPLMMVFQWLILLELLALLLILGV
jgi:hypothetical protein